MRSVTWRGNFANRVTLPFLVMAFYFNSLIFFFSHCKLFRSAGRSRRHYLAQKEEPRSSNESRALPGFGAIFWTRFALAPQNTQCNSNTLLKSEPWVIFNHTVKIVLAPPVSRPAYEGEKSAYQTFRLAESWHEKCRRKVVYFDHTTLIGFFLFVCSSMKWFYCIFVDIIKLSA